MKYMIILVTACGMSPMTVFGRSITGIVVDHEIRRIAGANIQVDCSGRVIHAISGETGLFRVEDAAGDCHLSVKSPGFLPSEVPLFSKSIEAVAAVAVILIPNVGFSEGSIRPRLSSLSFSAGSAPDSMFTLRFERIAVQSSKVELQGKPIVLLSNKMSAVAAAASCESLNGEFICRLSKLRAIDGGGREVFCETWSTGSDSIARCSPSSP